MDKATEKELAPVHKEFAEWCLEIMKGCPLMDKDGKAVLKPDGQPYIVPPSPAYLNVIRQFLKDNHVEAVAAPGTPLSDLSDLPMFDEDGKVVPIKASQRL